MTNLDPQAIAAQLRLIGDWLDFGGDRYRARAYHNGADVFEGTPDAERLLRAGRLTELSGIGEGLAKQIAELATTGHSSYLDKLRDGRPDEILTLPRAAGLSTQKFLPLYEKLGIRSYDQLVLAIESGALAGLKGFGEKTIAKMKASLADFRTRGDAMTLDAADEVSAQLCDYLRPEGSTDEIVVAGARRRAEDTVDRIELAGKSHDPAALLARFVAFPRAAQIEQQREDRATIRLTSGLFVSLRVAPLDRFGVVLLDATGPTDHVAAIESRLRARGRSLTEAGFADERDVYAAAGVPFVPAELRHDEAVLDATTTFDDLITQNDLVGMTHCHTVYSDGVATIEAMALAAEARGFRYLTITDHSPSATYAGGVDLDRLKRQWDEIAEVQSRVSIRLLRGTESDILQDGALDYPDHVLRQLDVVIASIHTRHKLDREQMTARLVTAMRHPLFKIWGHALGRLLLKRDPFECDIERVFDAIAESRAAIEINADPYRLDLPSDLIPGARARGIRFVISTDAHSVRGLDNLHYGIGVARRGGVRAREVLNTLPTEDFLRAVRPAG